MRRAARPPFTRPTLALLAITAMVAAGCTTDSGGSMSVTRQASTSGPTGSGPAGGSGPGGSSGPSGAGAEGIGADGLGATAATSLTWRNSCPGDDQQTTVPLQCARLVVPLDYAKPDGPSIELTLARVESTGTPRGTLVMNPGGPGASGVEALGGLAGQLPSEITDAYDIVSFDPRGVGASAGVRCLSDQQMDERFFDPAVPDPTTESAREQQDRDACAARFGRVLPHVGTMNAARDLDRIRIALGRERLDYLGYSYGTLLGATYADLFPDRVGRFVLDGPVDPAQDSEEQAKQQIQGFASVYDRWAQACSAAPTCPLGADPKAKVEELKQRLKSGPIPARSFGGNARLTISNAATALIATFYDESSWAVSAQGIADALAGDGSVLVAMAASYAGRSSDGTWNTISASNAAVSCADTTERPPVTPPDTTRDPLAGWPFGDPNDTGADESCAGWPASAAPRTTDRAEGIPPVLIVATTGDPATPVGWASKLAEALPGSSVLRFSGEGHTVYPGSSSCVDAQVNAFLIDGRMPTASECAKDAPGSVPATGVPVDNGPDFGNLGRTLGDVTAPFVVDSLPPGRTLPPDYPSCVDERIEGVSESELALLLVLDDPEALDPAVLGRVQQATARCVLGG